MRWIFACLIGVVLSLAVGSRVAHADPIPGPAVPDKPAKLRHDAATVPVYAVSAGAVAVILTGSFIALRVIRKRNEKQPD
jgi:H+/gluconate symporter-like permease